MHGLRSNSVVPIGKCALDMWSLSPCHPADEDRATDKRRVYAILEPSLGPPSHLVNFSPRVRIQHNDASGCMHSRRGEANETDINLESTLGGSQMRCASLHSHCAHCRLLRPSRDTPINCVRYYGHHYYWTPHCLACRCCRVIRSHSPDGSPPEAQRSHASRPRWVARHRERVRRSGRLPVEDVCEMGRAVGYVPPLPLRLMLR